MVANVYCLKSIANITIIKEGEVDIYYSLILK